MAVIPLEMCDLLSDAIPRMNMKMGWGFWRFSPLAFYRMSREADSTSSFYFFMPLFAGYPAQLFGFSIYIDLQMPDGAWAFIDKCNHCGTPPRQMTERLCQYCGAPLWRE